MKKIILLIALILITASLFAADYAYGTILNNEGNRQQASASLYIMTPMGWMEIDWDMQNDPVTGAYHLCFEGLQGPQYVKVEATIWCSGVKLAKYYNWTDGQDIVCNFIYQPVHQD